MSENIITVTQFSNYVKQIFMSEELLHNILICGEVSDINVSRNIAYFNLKDENALLQCVRFGADAGYLPKEGEMVLVRGSPNYYVKGGRFSFNVSKIEPYGQGILYQKFLELKQKLEAEGLFDEKVKKPLPDVIKKIGVITSEDGAVLQDIIDITGRRNPMLNILLFPAKVQGIGAEQTIVEGLKQLDKTDVDVIIIARGGGSLEDLSCFNAEIIARQIFATNKPVISAVGHETDFTIADFVADLRAPTPSAAAELVSVDVEGLKQRFFALVRKLEIETVQKIDTCKETLFSNTKLLLNLAQNKIDVSIPLFRENAIKLYNLQDKIWLKNENQLDILSSKIEKFNPIKILKMGYAQIRKQNQIVEKPEQIDVGDNIDVELKNTIINCEVRGKKRK